MNTNVIKIISCANAYYRQCSKESHSRFKSWEHCYKAYYLARKQKKPDVDKLCLHLAFYLASWGMYRGSSFLLQKDYQIHEDIVKTLLDKRYDPLCGIRCNQYLEDDNIDLLDELYNNISSKYRIVRSSVRDDDVETEISQTLITKILLGTMGCVPAYDQYFKKGLRALGIASGEFSKQSISDISEWYLEHEDKFEKTRKNMIIENGEERLLYPQMKVIDMGFWQFGAQIC